MTLFYILATVFAIIVLVRIMNIITLSDSLAEENAEEELIQETSKNAFGLYAFMIVGIFIFFYLIHIYMPLTLPEAASVHGVETDFLLNVNFIVIIIVFVLTQIALGWCVWKYKYKKGHKAYFYPHNNTIEIIWTIVPTIVLAGLVITGLKTWNNITQSQHKDGMNIQIYAKQFNFVIRYSGQDNALADSYFRNITDENPLGVKREQSAKDDQLASELHLVVNQPIMLHLNSRDVIHSMYLPHFRTQMNAVPGMTTTFYFVPTITTAEMRKKLNDPKFDYVLLCNKICGVSHYLMNMKVIVESPEDFKKWIKGQKYVFPEDSSMAQTEQTANAPLAIKQDSPTK